MPNVTGEPGVCCATAGPGATNLVSGIAEAFVGALPIVILAGRGPATTSHKGASQVEKYRSLGYEAAFTDRTPHGYRIAYMDTTRDLPGMIELVEYTQSMEERYTKMYHASVGWDGSDPIRPPVRTHIAPLS